MRYTCEEPGFDGCFVEFTESGWTRRDQKAIRSLEESEEWFALLRTKVTGVHLVTVDGQAIDTPAGITPEMLDGMDVVLFNWFVGVIVLALGEVNSLGNAVWRRLFATPATTPAEAAPTA